MTNLILRILTAILMGGVALWFTWRGGALFAAFSWLIGAAVLYEWMSLVSQKIGKTTRVVTWCFYIVIGYMLLLELPGSLLFPTILVSSVIVALTASGGFIWAGGGLIYTAVPAAALALTRGNGDSGFGLIVFLFSVVWATDIGAYFTGRAIGGPKLVPQISPNKTLSGAVGGALFGVLSAILAVYMMSGRLFNLPQLMLLALTLSIVSQIGDIGESWIKRYFSVKDSSTLLPGHGGFMDRVDGLVCAVVVLYLVTNLFSSIQIPLGV